MNNKLTIMAENETDLREEEKTPYYGVTIPEEEMTKEDKTKILRRIGYLVVILILIGITVGWMVMGVFAFLFMPFLFWGKIGELVRKAIKKE